MASDYYSGVGLPTWEGSAPQPTNRYKRTTGTYDPNADMTGSTIYDNTQKSAVDKLNSIITNGGYSNADKQSMIAGAMAPVYQEANTQRDNAQNDAYSRGVGQSTVLSNNYGKIDQNVLNNLSTISGQVTKEGADMVPQAIQLAQSGVGQQLDFQKSKADLMAQTNMNEAQIEQAYTAINSAADKNDADRELQYTNLKNQFNLSDAQLNLMIQQAKASQANTESEQQSNLISNALGSGASVLGKLLSFI